MTKSEANMAVQNANNRHWFCPQINNECRHDCLCFDRSYVTKNPHIHPDERSYFATSARCVHKDHSED